MNSRQRLGHSCVVGLAFLCFAGHTHAQYVHESINEFLAPDAVVWNFSDVGWFYTPQSTFTLTGVSTNFSITDGRSVSVEIYDQFPAAGGTRLRNASFFPSANVFSGGSFSPLTFTAGEEYFLGFRNVKNLGTNVTSQPGAASLGTAYVSDDGSYSAGAESGTRASNPILRFLSSDQAPAQKVVLVFGHDAPWNLVGRSFGDNSLYIEVPTGTPLSHSLDALAVTEPYKADVLDRVRAMFSSSGVTNVDIAVGSAAPDATNVYFCDSFDANLLGKAKGGNDRFNCDPYGNVVVFAGGLTTPNLVAETAAHEVGHTLGLRHVNPSSSVDPDNLEIMDYDGDAPPAPRFINAVSQVFDFQSPYNHNPVYHLKRYVDGETPEQLAAAGITPGTWDTGLIHALRTGLTTEAPDRMLYDVDVLAREGDAASAMRLAHFDQILLSELGTLQFDLNADAMLGLLASSAPGGPTDISLASAAPSSIDNLFVRPVDGQVLAQLLLDAGPGGYTPIADVTVTASPVPEPGTLFLALLCALPVTRRRRRGAA
ncbi:MAG: hypothetical protein QOF78_3680 [Phycisphaerales bacterium]|nr:hypothetical protein [Phycisphaerales bacterium]